MTWSKVALGEITVHRGGSVNPKKHLDEVFELYSIPSFDAGSPEILLGSEIGSSKKCIEPNDVIVSRIIPHIRRAWVVGPTNGHRQIASGEWIIFRSEDLWPYYLRWVLVGDVFHSEFMKTLSGVGGSLLRARPSEVAKIKIPLPPLVEQKRIAEILDEADALRVKRREAIAQLDTFLQSTFIDMFGDPVSNPMEWNESRVEDICRLVRGSSPRPKGDPKFYGGPVPRLMVGDITRDGFWVTPRIDSLTKEGASKSRPVPAGTVVMAVSGNVGVVATVKIPCCVHDGFVAFLELSESVFDSRFFMFLFHFLKTTHDKRKAGAIFQNLTTKDIKSMQLPTPPLELQRRFATIVEAVEQQKASMHAHLAELDALFASLQHRAFNGEL